MAILSLPKIVWKFEMFILRLTIGAFWLHLVLANGDIPPLTVYHGAVAKEGMFSSIGRVVLDVIKKDRLYKGYCGATLISSEWAVTAAHCFYDNNERTIINATSVTFGDVNINQRTQWHQASSFEPIIHEHYNEETDENDIALLHLKRKINKTENVCPEKMSTSSNEEETFIMCQVAGWGFSDQNVSKISDNLLYANMSFTNGTKCKNKVLHDSKVFNEKTMLCAGSTTSDACSGDSGGPLYCLNTKTSRRELVGIVSYGDSICHPSTTGVYTRVSAYQSWIDGKMKGKNLVPLWITLSCVGTVLIIVIIVIWIKRPCCLKRGYEDV